MINAVRSQASMIKDDDSIRDDVLKIKNIKTDKFDDETDSTIYKTVLDKYSSEDLRKNLVKIINNPSLDDNEKSTLRENMLFLIDKKMEEEDKEIEESDKLLQEVKNEEREQKEMDLKKADELKKLLSEDNDETKDTDKDENTDETSNTQEDKVVTNEEIKNTELLNGGEKVDAAQEEMNKLLEDLKKLSDKNHEALESLKEARKSKNQELIDLRRKIILRLIKEKEALKDKYAGKLPQYKGNIQTVETKRIELKLFGNKSIDGQKVLTGPQLRFRQNLRSRRRINTTVNKLNEIGNDPKKGVNFVLTRTFGYDPLGISGKIGTGFKSIRKFFKIRDVKTFDEMYNKQKKYFIDDLESKMAENSMSENDKKVIAAIRNRLDYYQAAYKRQFITA